MRGRRKTTAVASVVGGVVGSMMLLSAPAAAGPSGAIPGSSGGRSLCAPPPDTVGPTVDKVTFGKSSIDLNTGSRLQTVRAIASDTSGHGAASGVRAIRVYIRGNRFGTAVTLKLISGTAESGHWTGHFTVSKYAHPGTYSVDDIFVQDADGNRQSYYGFGGAPQSPDALSLHPEDAPTFSVTGTPATRPPGKPAGTLKSFSFTPTTIDTTVAPRRVHVVASFRGVSPRRVSVEFISDKRDRVARFVFLRTKLHHQVGKWTGSVLVPRWLGKQSLQPYLYVTYGSGYRPIARSYDPDALFRLGLPDKLNVVSGIDKTKPTLGTLSFSPGAVDSTTGAQTLTVTSRAHDVGSGVQSIDVEGYIRHGSNGVADGYYPLAAAGVGYLSSDSFRVRLHKQTDGTWMGQTTIRKCVPSGWYRLSASLRDVAGNYHSYSTKQLANANLRSRIHVTSKHGDVEKPYVYSAATYGAEHKVFLNFSEGVATVDTSTLAIYALAPPSTRYQSPESITAITCSNGHIAVDCSGTSGLVTSAVLVVPSMRVGRTYSVFANLHQVVPQLVDGNGNAMDWNYEAVQVKDS